MNMHQPHFTWNAYPPAPSPFQVHHQYFSQPQMPPPQQGYSGHLPPQPITQPPQQQPPQQQPVNAQPQQTQEAQQTGLQQHPPRTQPANWIKAFQKEDGSFDFDKATATVDQVVKTANQIHPLVKQMSNWFTLK
ncbi:YppG family protein [Texcoconibacillus texcoconensis]|uniref:Outer membrane protein OmpA-like peptidoglycan-associated protein n=1 Tax=Texcoconibacillus texcoconensis TaxID=1095777 RepID=A0A840QLN0_9BACI|nr:YppG family protein [Texcoconibacillus texcoconensis]MBB5172261.1 outer membrane protein OmpA-like peptidoglycan-associated protein [Texcoconibacillus texcoconensis]